MELEPVLLEEIQAWRKQLDWDFQSSADLVRRYADARALSGYALVAESRVAGYTYCISEEHKGLVGDLYVLDRYRTADNENRLLRAVLEKLMRSPYVRRVESQLMLLQPNHVRGLPAPDFLSVFERRFMSYDAVGLASLKPRTAGLEVVFDQWTERRQEEAAELIASAYRGHIDSEINDQYRSVSGARRFLYNIVQYPGCGSFFAPGSWVALRRDTGRLCGICLSSLVAADVGHITQICVAPALQGAGLGYELMRRSLVSLAHAGCRRISLTVTSANRDAVRLYEKMGFETIRRFPALVWDGF